MIKKYWEITLRDYNIMEKSGAINQYKKWYNPFPVKFFVNRISKQLNILAEKLNTTFGDNEEMKRESLLWEVVNLNLINAIRINFLGITNILELSTRLNLLTKTQTRKIKRKLKFNNSNLKIYIENINKLTGINILELKDIIEVDEYLEHRMDKYNEMIRKKQIDIDEKVYLLDIVIRMFNYLNQTVNVNLTVLEFIDFKNIAIEKSNKERALTNG